MQAKNGYVPRAIFGEMLESFLKKVPAKISKNIFMSEHDH